MSPKSLSPYDCFEPDVDIAGKSAIDDPEVMTLYTRNQTIKDDMFAYWKPSFDTAQKCFDYIDGNIFSATDKYRMKAVEGKIPVEPRIMQPRIFSLVGEILQGRRSGTVTTEGGDMEHPAVSAPLVEIANIVLKDMETRFEERALVREWLFNALISCMPNWIWIDKALSSDGVGTLKASLLPWNSVAAGPFNFKRAKDFKSICFVDFVKEDELIESCPDMEDVIKKHRAAMTGAKDKSFISSLADWSRQVNISNKDQLYQDATRGTTSAIAPDGYYERYTRVFPVRKKEKVAVNLLDPKSFEVRPPDWDDERWGAFLTEKKSSGEPYEEAEREVVILWQCRWTADGLMLENKKNWYQERGELPGVAFVPLLLNSKPTGPAVAQLNSILKAAVFETEFLHDMRTGGSSFWVLRDKSVLNVGSFPTEVAKKDGLVVVAQESGPIDSSIHNIPKPVNKAALEYAQKAREDLDEVDKVNQIQGIQAPRQSAVAKNMELAQGMLAQSQYVENFNTAWEQFQNLKCKLIPRGYNKYDILRVKDEVTGDTKVAAVNEPQYGMDGSIEAVANDLSRHEFTYKMAIVDDSPTAKQREFESFMIFINSVPGPVMAADPSGKTLARYMMAVPNNNILQQCGKALAQDAELKQKSMGEKEQQKTMSEMQLKMAKLKIEAEKVKKMGFALGITGEQLMMFPTLTEYLMEAGLINFIGATPQIGQPPAVPEPAVPAQPQP